MNIQTKRRSRSESSIRPFGRTIGNNLSGFEYAKKSYLRALESTNDPCFLRGKFRQWIHSCTTIPQLKELQKYCNQESEEYKLTMKKWDVICMELFLGAKSLKELRKVSKLARVGILRDFIFCAISFKKKNPREKDFLKIFLNHEDNNPLTRLLNRRSEL